MENFFKWLVIPVPKDELETYFNMNNINREKVDLFSDILISLNNTITKTYLGDSENSSLSVEYSDEDKEKHFDWCWNKTLSNFSKEGINFEIKGEHYDYFKTFFEDIFYNQNEKNIRESIGKFLTDLFNTEKPFTKSDLDMIYAIYKNLDKTLSIKKK